MKFHELHKFAHSGLIFVLTLFLGKVIITVINTNQGKRRSLINQLHQAFLAQQCRRLRVS